MSLLTTESSTEPYARRWTAKEYWRLAEQGFFVGKKVELLWGEIYDKGPRTPRKLRWTAREYWRLAKHGAFDGERIQLINGEIIKMPPQGPPHSYAIIQVSKILGTLFGTEHSIRVQMPLNVPGDSVPEPDIAAAEYSDQHYRKVHPQTALLVVEISDSSLYLDRIKAEIYAAAKIPEYWIVNVADQNLELYRKPKRDSKSESGYAYSEKKTLKSNDSISPLARPKAKIEVKRFFE